MREYVSTKVRDGLRKGRKTASSDSHTRAATLLGAEAHGKGQPRWSNPLVGDRARAWTRGGNTAQLPADPPGCPGGRLWVVGTAPADAS